MNYLFPSSQYGFRGILSTTGNEKILSFEKKNHTQVTLYDLTKAFDSVKFANKHQAILKLNMAFRKVPFWDLTSF